MVTSLIKLSSRGVRSLHPTNFRSPWPFVKKGAYGQRKIGPFNYEKHKWPGQNREFPELSPKWHKENPKELNRYTGVQDEGYIDPVTGKYVVVPEMQSCLVVPNLDGFKLKPYVSFRTDVEIEKRRRAYAAKMNVGLHQKWMQRRCLSFAMEGRSEKLLRMSALVILADGAEEMEAVITIDVLRRGGVDVTVAGLTGSNPVKCSRKTVITPDCALKDVLSKTFSVVILPGGQPGSNTLAASSDVGQVLKAHHNASKYVAAICAAPIALKSHGIPATMVTSHPSVRKQLEEGGYKYSEDRVVVADRIVTSRGPGTAFEFALKLVELLVGAEKSKELVAPMLLKL